MITTNATSVRSRFGFEFRLLIPMFACSFGIGSLPLVTLPWLIGSLTRDWGYADGSAGTIVTGELAVSALTTVIIGSLVHRLPRRLVCLGGACLVLLSNALLLSLPTSAILVPALAATALGCGACSATGNSLLVASTDPARLTAQMWALTVPWQALVWFITPIVVERWRPAGLFALLAGACLIYLPLIFFLMPRAGTPASKRSSEISVEGRSRMTWAIPIFICAFAFWLRDSLTWSLGERRGVLLGVTEYHLGLTLTVASLLGLAGPLTANLLGMRLGRMKTLLAGLAFLGIVMQVIASAASPVPYEAGFVMWPAASIFAWTYVMEMAAAADSEGRVAAICGGIVFAASAVGPMAGGVLMQWANGAALPSVVCGLSAATLLTAYATKRRV